MTLLIGYISGFDGITLHNGTTLFAADRLIQQPKFAVVRYVTMASGSLYDMDGSDDNTLQPQAFESQVLIVQTSAANLQTSINTITAKTGLRGVLTGVQVNTATSYTCTARLREVNYEPLVNSLNSQTSMKLRLSWMPSTNWA